MQAINRRSVLIGLPSIAVLFITLLIAGCLPIGPILLMSGGRLRGELHRGPEPSWSEYAEEGVLELEVSPDAPRSVNVGLIVIEDRLFVPATLEPAEKRWPRAIRDDPRVVARLHGTLYPRKALRVLDPELLALLLDAGQKKYDPSYFEPTRTWFFELAPRDPL